jgi:hypothetical protein
VLDERDVVEDVAREGLVGAFGGVVALGDGAFGLERGDVLGAGQAELVGHAVGAHDGGVAQQAQLVGAEVGAADDAGERDAAEMQEVVVLVPRVLEDAVLELDAGLAVVGARDDGDGAMHAAGVVLELGEIDRRQVAERAVAEEDFRAGIHAGEPRRAVERGGAVDEAGLRAARGEHQVEDAAQFGARGLVVEDERVVGLAALGLALAPIVLSCRRRIPAIRGSRIRRG